MTAKKKKLPCLVFGNGITALGVVRSLGRAGIISYCAENNIADVKFSRWFKPLPSGSSTLGPSDTSVADFIATTNIPSAVLIPCSDDFALKIAKLPPELKSQFPSIQPPESALRSCIDKGAFATVLTACGVPHPKSYAFSESKQFSEIPDDFFRSSFLKPRDSQSFFRKYGVKARKVYSREEAVRSFEEFTRAGMSMLFQEYIPGPPSNHYFVDGYVDSSGTLRALFARQRTRMYPPDFGNSSYMTAVPLHQVAPAQESLAKIFVALNYRGIFSAEFKKDQRDGSLRILEINARPWWFIEFAARCGVNVCELLYRDATGESLPSMPRYAIGQSCVNLYYDWHAAQDLIRTGELSRTAVLFSWVRAKKTLFCIDDPLPSLAWFSSSVMRKLSRRFSAEQTAMQPRKA